MYSLEWLSLKLTQVIGYVMAAEMGRPTEAILRQAEDAIAQGVLVICLGQLELAQIHLPSSSEISLAVGLCRMLLGDARATEPLELIAARTNDRDMILYLILARLTFGARDHAAADLHRLLQSHAPGSSLAFAELCDRVVNETGAFGWCGLFSDGRLIARPAFEGIKVKDIEVLLDGQRKPIRITRQSARSPCYVIETDGGWLSGNRIAVCFRGCPLIGSSIEIQQVTRMEGFVLAERGGISGWCWFPNDVDRRPTVTMFSRSDPLRHVEPSMAAGSRGLENATIISQPWTFTATREELSDLPGAIHVLGPTRKALYGSPVSPRSLIDSARELMRAVASRYPRRLSVTDEQTTLVCHEAGIPVSAAIVDQRPPLPYVKPRVAVVVPVYRGLDVTINCIKSVLAADQTPPRIIVVVDDSPDDALVAVLREMSFRGEIELHMQSVNSGFPITANIGLRLAGDDDVILLNSDTLVPPGWIQRLQAAIYQSDDIGTATPLSNDASIFSYPVTNAENRFLTLPETITLDEISSRANGLDVVDVPTANGFCVYIRAACLEDTGVFREDLFGQGYAEENDLSRRASILGWRHVAVPGVYVGHLGGQSFAPNKTALIRRNLAILNRLHIGYDQLVQDWLAADPLCEARRNIDVLRLRKLIAERRAILLVTHDREGGVLRHVRERATHHIAAGFVPLVLAPVVDARGKHVTRIAVPSHIGFPNITFRQGEGLDPIVDMLTLCHVDRIEIHHFIGHDEPLIARITSVGIPYDVYVHDYSWFCPRITLTTAANVFCGEPVVSVCTRCVAEHGSKLGEKIAPAALRVRSKDVLGRAAAVLAPSQDAAKRFRRQLAIEVTVGDWEPKVVPHRLRTVPPSGKTRVAIVGAIGLEKGYDTLRRCAQFVASRDLPIEFVVVGYTCDDKALLDTGCVRITGRYTEAEVVPLIVAQAAHFAFLPALWPETWSYVLTQIWQAGLPVVAYDIGAPAERIRATGNGLLIPLHLKTEATISLFLRPQLFGSPQDGRPFQRADATISAAQAVIRPANGAAMPSGIIQ
jgi:GT2 family glycosyltransferase